MSRKTSEQEKYRSNASGRFQKGRSGNPGGRPRVSNEVRSLARSKAPSALKRLVELMDSKDPRVAIAASNAVLDRAYGKPSAEEHTATFAMKQVTSAGDVVNAIADLLKAAANGDVSIAEAKELTAIIEVQRKAIETTDLEVRVKKLEEGS